MMLFARKYYVVVFVFLLLHMHAQLCEVAAVEHGFPSSNFTSPKCLTDYFRTSSWKDPGNPTALFNYWNRARAAAKLSPPLISTSVPNSFTWPVVKHSMVLRFVSGRALNLYVCQNLAYVRVFKCANNAIHANLLDSCSRDPHRRWIEHSTIPHQFWDNRFAQGVSTSNKLVVYTFVRDPFSHFISGYREAAFRTFRDCCDLRVDITKKQSTLGRKKKGNRHCNYWFGPECDTFADPKTTARYFLRLLLDANLENGYFAHLFTMVSFVYAELHGRFQEPDFIGRLENGLDNEYDRLCQLQQDLCPRSLTPTNMSLDSKKMHVNHTESSGDVFGFGRGLQEVFKESPHLLQAVKILIEPDVACFGDDKLTS
eukprot:m.150565 g.150565  ORF g.150565 m.150565 type:complete len:370 (-) comp30732_c0_seq4:414-1523(-)